MNRYVGRWRRNAVKGQESYSPHVSEWPLPWIAVIALLHTHLWPAPVSLQQYLSLKIARILEGVAGSTSMTSKDRAVAEAPQKF